MKGMERLVKLGAVSWALLLTGSATLEGRDVIVLGVGDATRSSGVELHGDALVGWKPGSTALWKLPRGRGSYDVVVSYSLEDPEAAAQIEVQVTDGYWAVPGRLLATATSAEEMPRRSVPLGLISLPFGATELTLTAKEAPAGLGIREVRLEPGFVSLFNGRNQEGWYDANRRGRGYIVEDGILTCPARGGGNFFTSEEYGDFHFRFEFRLYENSNNGLGIRAPGDRSDCAYHAMAEIQILDDSGPAFHDKLEPYQYHGSVYHLVPAKRGYLRPVGEWNVEEVVCDGSKILVRLNGVTIVDADLADIEDPELREKHPGMTRTRGHIGFLGHGSRVDFRNIRIRDLSRG